jgi:predicted XRE-type DNA-binding protein
VKKTKKTVTKNAAELAEALGLTPADAVEIEFRSDLNDRIIEIVKKLKLTHAQVAKLAGTSRTRVTALLNRNAQDISADLMLRIIASLGYRAKISVSKAA